MKLIINQLVLDKIPGVQAGVIVLKNLNNRRKYTTVDQLLRGVCAQKKNELKNDVRLKEINTIFQKARSGNLVIPSAQLLESDINKIARGREIKSLNNLYTLIHYLGIKYLVPIFAYDLDMVGEDLEINFAESKQGKRPNDIEVTSETVHTVIWFVNLGGSTREDFEKLPAEFVNLLSKYCGGSDADIHILDADNPEADLNYESDLEKENLAIKEAALVEQMAQEAKKEQEKMEREADMEREQDTLLEPADPESPPFLRESSSSKQSNLPMTPKQEIQNAVFAAVNELLATAVPSAEEENQSITLEDIEVEVPADLSNGRYSANIAMKLAKKLQKPPREIAEALIQIIQKPEFIGKVEAAGAGFINFHLSEKYLVETLNLIISQKGNYGRLGIGRGVRALVEYSSPNIAKPLGVHHLLSTIIGQTLSDLFRYAGYETLSLNWPGDWGTQFGKLIHAYKTWGDEETVKKDPLNELLKLYVKFHDEEEKTPELVEKGREEFRKLEEGDEENNNLWEWFRDVSIKELGRLYKELGVSFDEYLGERMYLDDARQVIEDGMRLGIVEEGEKGALIVKFENDKYPPYMLRKADGTTLYSSRDLASLKDRIQRLKGDKIIYVIDVAQKLHMQQLFETARKFKWGEAELKHVIFGRMQLPEGKMSTRKGDVILLDEVLKEARKRTIAIVEEKSKELSTEEKNHIAEKMAVGAIKYNIISQNPETNITFEWDRMLSLEGNSGPYLQYTCARAKSILRKAKEQVDAPAPAHTHAPVSERQTDLFMLTEEAKKQETPAPAEQQATEPYTLKCEKELILMLTLFPEVIEQAVNEYRPNPVTTYLYDLARAFNSFYNEASVLNADSEQQKNARLKLVEALARVMENGLNVLGMEAFERM